jgi:hypothetical protein
MNECIDTEMTRAPAVGALVSLIKSTSLENRKTTVLRVTRSASYFLAYSFSFAMLSMLDASSSPELPQLSTS